MKHTFYLITLSALTALFCAGPARAQYTANFQTNIINVVSNWVSGSGYRVGDTTYGNALIINSGGVLSNGFGYLGYTTGSSNNVAIVTGTGSVWSNSFGLHVGLDGAGNQLVVTNGGTVFNTSGVLGRLSRSRNNVAIVTGTGSVWSNSDLLYVGLDGAGNQLVVTNGGTVFNTSGVLGDASTSSNNVAIVTGTGSVWSNSANLYVGHRGAGNQLVVTNGGTVFNTVGYLGDSSTSSNNVAIVTSTGSVWSNRFDLFVGRAGAGNQLVVTNGGTVFNTFGFLGNNPSSSNNVATVSGGGAKWENRRDLYVGFSGDTNTLNIGTGGSVIASNAYVGFNAGADGNRINVTGGALYVTNAPGTGTLDIRRGTLTFDSGTVDVDRLVLSNGTASVFHFNGGTLLTKSTLVTNGALFTVGNGSTAGTMQLQGGTHGFSNGVTVAANSRLRVVGNTATITGPGLVNQAGGIVTTSFGGLVIQGAFTNAGTFSMMHSVGTFGTVVNAGAWIIDPTTNVFNSNFITTESGYISATAGDVFIFTNDNVTAGHFLNRSTNSAAFDTADAKFLFSSTLAVTQHFYAAGLNREALSPSVGVTDVVTGSWSAATFTNFSLGTLEISNFSTVRVWDAFSGLGGEFGANDGLKAALYVDNLLLGLNSFLIISDNVEVYFRTSNSWSSAHYSLLGNGELHQFFDAAIIPEPSTLLLLCAGGILLQRLRTRYRAGAVASPSVAAVPVPTGPAAAAALAGSTSSHNPSHPSPFPVGICSATAPVVVGFSGCRCGACPANKIRILKCAITGYRPPHSMKRFTNQQRDELLQMLKARFEQNMTRHTGLEWDKVEARLKAKPDKLGALLEMERTGGEPDVIGHDGTTGEYLFCDCSAETPRGRCSVCYDRAALESRKEHQPKTSALDMADAMGVELLTEEQYHQLQTLGEFDTKTSSWLKTPAEIRRRGGALFGDRRYGRVFIYHNGAPSYYSSRGFRALLRV